MIDVPMPELTTSRATQVMIVEDETIIAMSLKDSLEAIGYEVPAIAASGEKAIEKAALIQPNLVLMDIRLKRGIDGIQAAEQIWNQLQIPVIFVTGHSDKSTLERAKATAPFGYILKPVRERELYVAIETALQRYEREQWLMTVLKGMGDGVIVIDTQSRIKFINSVAEGLTGWGQDEARDRHLSEIFNLVNEQTLLPISGLVTIAMQQGTIIDLTDSILLISRDGRKIPIADSVAPFRDSNGAVTGTVIVFRDVTQRRLAEERNLAMERTQQLELQMSELQRLNQLKDDFLSTVSHELRTPLVNIRMAIQMLEITLNQQIPLMLQGNSETNRMARYMDILHQQCNKQLELINDLLNLQRLNADAYWLEPTPIQLQDWIPHVSEAFQERIQSRQQRLKIDLPADLPPLITDRPSLTRILTELLNNACKYTPPGEQIIVTAQALNQTPTAILQLKVINTGIEIPAAELPRIFDQFYRIQGSDRWNQGGTGLGLTLVKKLVIYLGGSIQPESSSGQTSFIVELPFNHSPNSRDQSP